MCMHCVILVGTAHIYIVAIQWWDPFSFQVVILAASGVVPVSSCGPLVHSSACTYPVGHYDGLFVSTGRGTPSAVPTQARTPVVLSPSLCIPWKKHRAFWHAMTLFCMFPLSYTLSSQTYTVVTAVLSIDTTCMVSWKHSVEYVDTQTHGQSVQFVCVLGVVLFVSGWEWSGWWDLSLSLVLFWEPFMSTVWSKCFKQDLLPLPLPFPHPLPFPFP